MNLENAIKFDNVKVVSKLLTKESASLKINQYHNLLTYACTCGSTEVAKFLIQTGLFDINEQILTNDNSNNGYNNNNNYTALFYAAKQKNKQIMKMLLEKGAKQNYITQHGYKYDVKGIPELTNDIKDLLNTFQKVKLEYEPDLFFVVKHGKIKLIELLLNIGSDINMTYEGKTLFDVAKNKETYDCLVNWTEHMLETNGLKRPRENGLVSDDKKVKMTE